MIQIQNVNKTFTGLSKHTEALRGVNLDISENTFSVIRGHSGSGKTTLLMCVGGMLRPSSGSVRIKGEDIYSLNIRERCRFRASSIGFVFQSFFLVPYLNVKENVLLSAGLVIDGNRQSKALALIDQLGLSDRILHKPSELSAGECQRVALVRALIHQPELILADEPTGNLDPANASEVLKILHDYHRSGGTVMLVTHGKDADQYADRIYSLNKGSIELSHKNNAISHGVIK
jgi:putative ABC transport system ATP-binding protein